MESLTSGLVGALLGVLGTLAMLRSQIAAIAADVKGLNERVTRIERADDYKHLHLLRPQ